MSSDRDIRALKRDLIKANFNTYRDSLPEILSDTSSEHSYKSLSLSNSLENLLELSEEDNSFRNTVINFSGNVSDTKMSSFNSELAIRIIPEFDGTNNFIKYLEMCQYFYDRINVETELDLFLQIIRLKLSGSAFEIFKYKKFSDWESFKEELSSHYLCTKTPQQLQRDLISTKQFQNESVRSFSNKIEKILAELNNSEKEGSAVIDYNANTALLTFVDGIYNSSLKIILKSKGCSNLKDAISLAIKEENSFPNSSCSQEPRQFNVSQNFNRPVNNFVRKFCSFCNVAGHVLQDCRSFSRKEQVNKAFGNKRGYELVCTYCGVGGHTMENCFKKRRGESQNNQVRYFSSSNSKNGMSSIEEPGVSGMNVEFAENLPASETVNQNQCRCQSRNLDHTHPETQ